jgi:hypothetical protein
MGATNISYRSPSYYEITNPEAGTWRSYRDEDYRAYRREWGRRPADRDPGVFPLHLDLDPTNACNLKCTMCPRTHYLETGRTKWAPGGKIGFMDFDLYRRILDQAADGGVYSLKLNFLGEPLLHPRVVDMVAYAKTKGLEVMMNSNATLLSPEMARSLLEAGLDDIFFSVDSPYPEEYERIRIGARFDQVIRNILTFIDLKEDLGLRHVQTRVSMVIGVEENSSRARSDFQALFQGLGVAEIGFGLKTEMELDYWSLYGPIPDFVCRDPYHRMFIYWDGLIGPCCGEWERGYLVGDANTQTLSQVWRNDQYKRLREAHESGRYHTLSICRKCSVPWLSRQEVEA